MKRINNPLLGQPDYQCFGCSPQNEFGLHMEFYEDGDEVVSQWTPRPEFQGWRDTLHGGIQATLIDEISSWVVFTKFLTSGVTTNIEVRYHKPVRTTDSHITLRAKALEQRRNLVRIGVELFNSAGDRCTEATCTYFLFPKEKAARDLDFCAKSATSPSAEASSEHAPTCPCGKL